MYHEFFGITENPFSITPDPRYLYMSKGHQEALAHLLYGVSESGGFVLLTGEVGTGKTSVCRCLLEQLPDAADVALVLNPRLSEIELLANICDELGVAYPAGSQSLKTLVDLLNRHLLDLHAKGRHGVVMIDEAQNLSPDVLEQVRLLTNLETAKRKLLQIILIGQPELHGLVNRKEMRQLAQRITARYHLKPLSRRETLAYIQHRLAVGGLAPDLFSRWAIASVYRRAHGIPRLINSLCDRCLLGAYAQNRKSVSRRLVRQAAVEVFGKGQRTHYRRATAMSWFGAALLVGATFFFTSPIDPEHQAIVDRIDQPAVIEPGPSQTGAEGAAGSEATAPPPEERVLGAVTEPDEAPAAAPPDEPLPGAVTEPDEAPAVADDTMAQDGGPGGGAANGADSLELPDQPETRAALAEPIAFDPAGPPGRPAGKSLWIRQLVERIPATAAAPVPTPVPQGPPAVVLTAALEDPAGGLTLEELLSRDELGSAAAATLLDLWGLEQAAGEIDELCAGPVRGGLKCLRGKVPWQNLVAFNRPVLLTLKNAADQGAAVVLAALAGGQATLRLGKERIQTDVERLKSLWTGDYLLLWRPPPVYRRILGRGSKGKDVLWLKERLAEINGAVRPEGETELFDGALRKAVIAFQKSRGLKPDGVVGDHTVIHLNGAAGLPPDAPLLH